MKINKNEQSYSVTECNIFYYTFENVGVGLLHQPTRTLHWGHKERKKERKKRKKKVPNSHKFTNI